MSTEREAVEAVARPSVLAALVEMRETIGNEYMDDSTRRRLTSSLDNLGTVLAPTPHSTRGADEMSETKVVPVEPTEAMLKAAYNAQHTYLGQLGDCLENAVPPPDLCEMQYNAMLAAAPPSPGALSEEEREALECCERGVACNGESYEPYSVFLVCTALRRLSGAPQD